MTEQQYAETVRTPLTCGHYFPGIHRGPHAWCRECLDFAMIGYPPDQFDGTS